MRVNRERFYKHMMNMPENSFDVFLSETRNRFGHNFGCSVNAQTSFKMFAAAVRAQMRQNAWLKKHPHAVSRHGMIDGIYPFRSFYDAIWRHAYAVSRHDVVHTSTSDSRRA